MSEFSDDSHILFPFGPYKGQKLQNVPGEWLSKLKFGPAFEAYIRINNRRGITRLINSTAPSYIPMMTKKSLDCLNLLRDSSINESLFGSFIEYLVKYTLGLRKFDQVEIYLEQHGLLSCPSHLTIKKPFLKPTKRTNFIRGSYSHLIKDIPDICNLSFCHSLTIGTFNEDNATTLYKYVLHHLDYFEKFVHSIVVSSLPRLSDIEQETCDKISVGTVVGVIDILSNDTIIDIKCCSSDNIDYYRQQLFGYYCLHRLRYPTKIINSLHILNFLTGNILSMDVSLIAYKICIEHIRNLGNFHPFHEKLF